MHSIRRTLIAAVAALLIPFAAGSASAAPVDATPLQQAPAVSLTGGTVVADTGLAARKAAEKASTIVEARRYRRGRAVRGLAVGIIAGAAAAAILSGAARAHDRPYRYRGEHYDRCEAWYFRCRDGFDRACRKYYRYCD